MEKKDQMLCKTVSIIMLLYILPIVIVFYNIFKYEYLHVLNLPLLLLYFIGLTVLPLLIFLIFRGFMKYTKRRSAFFFAVLLVLFFPIEIIGIFLSANASPTASMTDDRDNYNIICKSIYNYTVYDDLFPETAPEDALITAYHYMYKEDIEPVFDLYCEMQYNNFDHYTAEVERVNSMLTSVVYQAGDFKCINLKNDSNIMGYHCEIFAYNAETMTTRYIYSYCDRKYEYSDQSYYYELYWNLK
ncbi:MAG: hypothetical protein A2Y17_10130 [Clostridiales bacterium GWF2_38_85]|nr:MAG: hypothetical protein A2Y17_10130 [Clostridiales bacterium GWF2_38_85]HBL84473.1 hypothetical protein [Clostridiales bacterium]